MRLRVLVWNVRGFRAGAATAAAAVREEAADLVLLNEVGRSGLRLRRFARRQGMRRASGLRLWRRGVPNAVLARPPWRILEEEVVLLPRQAGARRRGLVSAVVGRSGYRLTAVAVHLGLLDRERVAHARAISDLLPSLRHPVLLGGDLNEEPGSPAASWLRERLWDAVEASGESPVATFPADEPRARIDYLLVSEGVSVAGVRVLRGPAAEASDHLPLLADLELE